MADLPAIRRNPQVEESRFKFAVSESMIQKMGSSIVFINDRQHSEKQFFANGKYNISGAPQTYVDGFTFFQFDAEIIDVWAFVQQAGSSGVTEIDIKRATTPGGPWNTIFTVTPSFNFAAGSDVWVHVGSIIPNTTAPQLGTTQVNAGDALRLDLLQVQGGSVITCGAVIHYRPR